MHRPTSDYRFSATRHRTSKRKSTKRNHILSSFGSTFVWSPGYWRINAGSTWNGLFVSGHKLLFPLRFLLTMPNGKGDVEAKLFGVSE